MPIMKFGKWQGHDYSEIPQDYLEWMIRDAEDKIKTCKHELDLRKNKAEDSWMNQIVEKGYAQLSALPDQAVIRPKLEAAYKALKAAIVEAAQPKGT